MLEYDRIDVSEGIDIKRIGNKILKECSLCHFWYFIDKNFNFQRYLCDGCHDMSKAMSMKNLAIVYDDKNAYRINFSFITLSKAN